MAAVIDSDALGLHASIECDRLGCPLEVTVRAAVAGDRAEGVGGYGLLCEAFDRAAASGWRLDGRAWCPEHARRPLGRRERRATGAWVGTPPPELRDRQRLS